ncbi:HDOD domain-containing protein [Marinomonas sp. 15G1-11]|uniref:HDOD domain-containing protein n=1 Tax=Marinomonas phaeophyticola TaxID=3004091 RepID=A0ABT4JV25_9GAMM|nr:HDOD domain-containing protein [Marinomonas sp. 15G1-11]MCZ2722101.1 HDOD domain-containing protein [Marinomonas sp. 15G1-11]
MSTEITESQLNRILQGITIPPQPQVMVDLHMEQAMPDPDLNRIASIISRDVGLSAAILKLINSSYYGLPRKVSSIKQAVMMLGISSISNIINGLSIKSQLSDDSIQSLHDFWDNAMDVAAVSASIAQQIGFRFQDECYSLGLFHNAGIPLMMMRFKDYNDVLEESYQDPNFELTNNENQHFKTNHSVVGYYLSKSWVLPKSSCHVIAHHHRTEQLFQERIAGDKSTLTFSSILKMAEHISGTYKIIGKAQIDYEWDKISEYALEHLELTQYDFEGIVEACHEQGIGLG